MTSIKCKKLLVFLLSLTLLGLIEVAVAQEAWEDIPYASLSEFIRKIRISDVEKEFGTVVAEANVNYGAANRHEWRRALADGARTFPFLTCLDTTEDISGYAAAQTLLRVIDTTTIETASTIVNTDDLYCAFVQTIAATAILIGSAGWKIQPLLGSMKLMPNSVETLDAPDEEGNYPAVDIVLCPQVPAQVQVTTFSTEPIQDASLRDKFSWWYELPSSRQEGDKQPPRRDFWEQVFDFVEQGGCNETVESQLIWEYFPSGNLNTSDTVTLTFNTTNSTSVDRLCALATLAALMASPDVCTIETRSPLETRNTNAQWLIQTGIEEQRPWFDVGLMGENQVVAVSDTGVDVYSCYFDDPNVEPPFDTRDNRHRKVVEYNTFVDNADYTYGHGTHVVGSVCASRDEQNPNSGMVPGQAPNAKVAFLDIGTPNGGLRTPSDSTTCNTGRLAEPRANIHSASWGAVGVPQYTIQTYNFDQYMYENDEFLMFIAAGNEGDNNEPYTVSSPATGKNMVSVGASHSCCDDLERGQLGPNHIASFSSRGPTLDGRTKPDIVAPGKWILSVGAQPGNPGACDPSSRPGANSHAEGVLSIQGTSMATPIAAGIAALVRQYFEEGFYPTGERVAENAINPSGALVKAVLMNGAQFLESVDTGTGTIDVSPYDNTQNFGRISLIDSLYIVGKSNVQAEVWDRQVVQNGRINTYEVEIDKSKGCESDILSVTLVWMEQGSIPGCSSCVLNDLDLSVTRQGDATVYYPNGRNSPDPINNSERVQVSQVQDGDVFTISVHGRNLSLSSQKYALVAAACFGGVKNELNVATNAFANDNSATNRRNTFIGVICGVVGGILLIGGIYCYCRRKNRLNAERARALRKGESDYNDVGVEIHHDNDEARQED